MSDLEDDSAAAPAEATPAPDAAASIRRVGLEILSALDPLDPRAVALDVFEVYCHEQLATDDVGRRAFLIKKMKVGSVCGMDESFGLFDTTTGFLLFLASPISCHPLDFEIGKTLAVECIGSQ